MGSYGVKLGAAPDAPRWGQVLACLPQVRSASSGGLRLSRTFTHPLTATPARRGRCTVEQGVRQLPPRPAIRSSWLTLATEPGLAPALAAAGVAGPSCSRRRCWQKRCFATALFRDSVAGHSGVWDTGADSTGVYSTGVCRTGVCRTGADNSGLATNDAGCGGRTVRGAAGRDIPARYEAAWGWRTAQQVARPVGRSLTAGGDGRVYGRHPHLGRTPRE